MHRHRTRRQFILRSTLALASTATCVPAQNSAPASDDGAWSLWAMIVDKLVAEYYTPLQETDLTRLAVEKLIADDSQLSARLKPSDYGATPADHRRVFEEFIRKLVALGGSAGKNATAYVERALELLCERDLIFSAYVPATVYDPFKRSGDAGPGFKVSIQDRRLVCLPQEESEASQKGIRPGDELLGVDDTSVEGMNIFRLKPLLYGREGSSVKLRVRQASGRVLTTSVFRHRSAQHNRSTLVTDAVGERVLIPTFDANTVADVREALGRVTSSFSLVLDLRGNSGGEFQYAADLLGLFVGGERPLKIGVKKQRTQPDADITTTETSISQTRRLTVLQDEGTASAAELFISALLLEPSVRVTVGGQGSYGKDIWNWEGDVPGGGFLHFARGTLVTKDGKGWAGGIKPTFAG
jgi:carboxyl-terminal processing protease